MTAPDDLFQMLLQADLACTPPNWDAVAREIAAGFISEQRHPSAPFRILNYTQRAQFDWRWNAETMRCRGLIVDDDNNIIARPFPKFFSYDQLNGVIPNEPFHAYEKMDGSLGILYRLGGQPQIASRGSFVSEQAYRATEIYSRKYQHVRLDAGMTYLFEVIYPENRIVVDYGMTEDLILLAIIETATGLEQPLDEIGFPIVKRYDGINDFCELLSKQDSMREGFVVRFESGHRVKIKFDEYKRLHKLLTGVSPSSIWDALRNGNDLGQLIERVPDEYFEWVRNTESELLTQFAEIESKARAEFLSSPQFASRKEAALHFQKCQYTSILFAMLDEKSYSDQIWKLIRPSGKPAFRCNMES